ncbi:hypothetical protein AURDEDRAFT_171037 [Auricularia subglabra TFB-10046 SS5]|nr:hypothetical protein AURDEDRAFT_171037 [Auricularia subglabra TFB-10046 SS5]
MSYLTHIHWELVRRSTVWRTQSQLKPLKLLSGITMLFPYAHELEWLHCVQDTITVGTVPITHLPASGFRRRLLAMIHEEITFLEDGRCSWQAALDRLDSKPATSGNEPWVAGVPASEKYPVLGWKVPQVAALALFLLSLELFFGLSRRGLGLVFDFAKLLVNDIICNSQVASDPETATIRQAFEDLPKDVANFMKKIDMSPKFTTFAVCPSCGHLSPPTQTELGNNTYMERCQNRVPEDGDFKHALRVV